MPAALLALGDQRLPSGGHVHSGGIEQAIRLGLVTDARSLSLFLTRRVRTTGLVAAGVAGAAWAVDAAGVAGLEAEADARMPSAAVRVASRAQGRGLLRTVRAAWPRPHGGLDWSDLGPRPHHPVVLGAAARAAGADAAGAALVAAYLCVTGPATAAQRLLALDPVEVAALTLALAAVVETVAAEATTRAGGPPAELPSEADPVLDLLAAMHGARTDCLFAS